MNEDKVVFYSLNQKFLDSDEDMPEQAQQVMYYSLAIGHHVGVIDCLKTLMECPTEEYRHWIAQLPEGGEARRKMEGLIKFGEITIDCTHTQLLAKAWSVVTKQLTEEQLLWTNTLMKALHDIEREPAIYLMVRRRN
ncbi:formate hydrogenlyase maturation protein HycH [Limnobaculum zhutongyuii]|uniref:Formate hydrogenlyase maturation protein HycH n=1 Tax=Limnobaculum zhutongyuii TaxID=2498113 RepID=A0A411WPQ0_9GAMM|nr:formate hydrogenlyase maturation HycH family protein [Limnobaculum zhutongyuii]QBH98168.1 formate hydrogenlyase maturation protein HycH [Limnobaculum zhutongyuii]TQS86358.1 formate hydrogenlyase maturation protein HycH [Limnobaculum zhutongyuii]